MGVDGDIAAELGTPIIALGIVLVVISCLGCSTSYFKNPCFAIPFGLINFTLAIVFFVITGFALGGAAVQDPIFALACSKDPNSPVAKFDQFYSWNIDKVMCSYPCPCKADPTWELGTNDEALRKFGRTIAATPAELIEYQNKANKAAVVPMMYAVNDHYTTFKECFKSLKDAGA